MPRRRVGSICTALLAAGSFAPLLPASEASGWGPPERAKRVCGGHVTGAPRPDGGPGGHIVWELWASRETTAQVAARYAAVHGAVPEEADGCRIWRRPEERPTAVLSVCPPTASVPGADCPRAPAGTATLVTISTMSRPSEPVAPGEPGPAPAGDAAVVARAVAAAVGRVLASKSADEQQRAFDEILGLGCPAVPVLVATLGDERRLPVRSLRLENRAADRFEAYRQYAPETLGDALAAILNQLTGRHFGFVYNGATPELRRRTVEDWQRLLRDTPPAELCSD